MVDNLMGRNRAKGAWALGGMLGLSLAFAGVAAAQTAPAGSPAGVAPVTASDINAPGAVAPIQRIALDNCYAPAASDRAIKFGAAGTSLPSGFELVTPGDARLKGANMRVIQIPGGGLIAVSGIAGVRSFELDVPDGDYRVILLTANSGQADTALAPFGGTITVNSVTQQVALGDSSKWIGNGTLGTPAAVPASQALPGTNNAGGASNCAGGAANAASNANAVSGSSTVGGLVIAAQASGGHLDVALTPASDHPDQQTLLVGVIAESTSHPSGLQNVVLPVYAQNAGTGIAAPPATTGETAAAVPARQHIGPSAKATDIPAGDTIPKPIVAPIPPPAPTLAEIPAMQIPPGVEQAAIDENAAGDAKLREFLTADNADAETITDRARSLVRDLFNNPAAQDKFLDISQHLAELTGNIVKEIAGGQIQRVAVAKDYLPGPNDKAVKFGAADSTALPGFELLTPQDPRIKGNDMSVLNCPDCSPPLLMSGITGVRSFQIDVPNGDYRVILLTSTSGKPDTAAAPFGGTVTVNSVALQVALSDPSKWAGHGTLSTPPAAQPEGNKLPGTTTPGTDTLPGTNNQGGVTTHQASVVQVGCGAAIMVTTHVSDNRLDVQFGSPGDHPDQHTFLAGVIAESTIHPSGLQGFFDPLDVQNAVMGDATSLFNPQAGGNGPNTTGAILDPQGTTTPPSYQNSVPPASPS